MEGTYDIPYRNPYIFVTTEPNRMGFCAEVQAINYQFKPYSDYFNNFESFWCWKSNSIIIIFFFFFLGGGDKRYSDIDRNLSTRSKNTLELTSQMSERSRTSASDCCLMFNDCKWYITLLPSATIYIPKFSQIINTNALINTIVAYDMCNTQQLTVGRNLCVETNAQ